MPTRQSVVRKRYVKEILVCGSITCGICGFPITNIKNLTVDHIVPKVLGGTDRVSNLQPAHFICNQIKGEQENFKLETGFEKKYESDTIQPRS